MSAKTEATEVEPTAVEKVEFKFQIAQLLAGVTAAVAAALIGSRLGVQGTLIGAAVTAVVAGMVSQFATFGFQRTHAGLQLVISRRGPSDSDAVAAEQAVVASGASVVRAAATQAKRGRSVHWGLALGGVALSAVVTFALTMGVLTVAESAAGRSVDGGYSTTVGGVAGKAVVEQPDAAPLVIPTATASPTPAPVTVSPVTDASPSPVSPDSPAPAPSPTPTVTTAPQATPDPAAASTTVAAPSAAPQPASP